MQGTTLGAYRLDAELGSGGMGTVYRATAQSRTRAAAPGDVVAVKVLHGDLLQRDGTFRRFLREAEIGRGIRHPNVMRTLDVDAVEVPGGTAHFLVLELVEGQSLREMLEELGRIPEALCRRIASGIAAGLGALHRAGVVHRDLKPSNVLVTHQSEVKVMDLGIARQVDPTTDISESGAFVGSLRYAAPEQFRASDRPLDGRVDLHALGVVLYEVATGGHPFRDGDFHQIVHSILDDRPRRVGIVNPQLSVFFEEIVHTLMAKDPDARFASADELVRVLAEGEEGRWWSSRSQELRAVTRRPLRRVRIPRETALHGRDEALARLRALFARAREGVGQVVILEGEAGIGKTRLIDELVGGLVEGGEDLDFVFGSYPPGGVATDTGAFCTAFREQLAGTDLDASLAEHLPQHRALVPALASLLRGEEAPEGAQALTKASLQTAFTALTHRFASERPVVVLIDDLHFAPREGVALFLSLAFAVAEYRVLLVGTSRGSLPEDASAGLERLPNATRMRLERLGPSDLGRLLVDAFGSERLAATLALPIAQRSDGNPYFVFEILRSLRETDRLRLRDDGSWATTSLLEEIRLPANLRELVHARLAELTEEDRDLLEVASCLGFEFDPLIVARALGQPEIPVLKRLGRLEHDRGVVRAVGRRCVFDHHQIREVLYEGLSELLRERYHGCLGDALEALGGEMTGGRAAKVCDQLVRGADVARALPYLDEAFAHLEGNHLHEHAAEVARRVLDAPGVVAGGDRFELLLRAARWLDVAGDSPGARATFLAAEEAGVELGGGEPLARARLERGRFEKECGAIDVAIELLRSAWELAEAAGSAIVACDARRHLGHAHFALGRVDEARAHIEAALDAARAEGDEAAEARCHGAMGVLLNRLGDRRGAIAEYEADLAVMRRRGDRAGESMMLANLGNAYLNLGEIERARACYQRSLELGIEIGDRQKMFVAGYNLAAIAHDEGRFREARDRLEEGLVVARELDYVAGVVASLSLLGMCALAMGRIGRSIECQRESLAAAGRAGRLASEAVAHVNLVPAYARLGAFDEARESSAEALRISRESKDPRVESFALFNTARMHDVLGEVDEAVDAMTRCVELRERIDQLAEMPATLEALSELLLRAGRVDEARARLADAVAAARRIDAAAAAARADARLAALDEGTVFVEPDLAAAREGEPNVPGTLDAAHRAWKATGDEAHLRVAHEALLTLLRHAPPEHAASMRTDVRAHAEILAAMDEVAGRGPDAEGPTVSGP